MAKRREEGNWDFQKLMPSTAIREKVCIHFVRLSQIMNNEREAVAATRKSDA